MRTLLSRPTTNNLGASCPSNKRVLYVKGSNTLHGSTQQLDSWFGTPAHAALQRWLRARRDGRVRGDHPGRRRPRRAAL